MPCLLAKSAALKLNEVVKSVDSSVQEDHHLETLLDPRMSPMDSH